MRGSLQKITIAFILIALLPIAFVVYELNSLSKNEGVVRNIYQKQLESILYSVNQYSDDVMNSWSNRVVREIAADQDDLDGIHDFMSQQEAIRYVVLTDLSAEPVIIGLDSTTAEPERIRSEIALAINNNLGRIKRLVQYEEVGFKKMEAIDTVLKSFPNYLAVAFAIGEASDYKMGVMVVDLPVFIRYTLSPKIQLIAQDKFMISIIDEKSNEVVYSTETLNSQGRTIRSEIKKEGQKTALWLLPGYYLGIALKDATIDDLVKDRVGTSTFVLVLLVLLIVGGIAFVYRNIRREFALSQAKSQFVSNVSHEIRTPLSLISMYAETLEMNRVSEEKKQEYYSIIVKETARLAKIVNRILNFSQAEANKKKYSLKPLQLNDVVEDVLDSYSFHLKDAGFTWHFNGEKELPEIIADRDSIVEAIINLIDNAIKYSRDQKIIAINTRANSKEVLLEIIDEGIGIPKSQHAAIFEQFHRVPSGDVHTTKGSGLGLTLVKKTMEAHSGKIKVESTPGKGSTFRLFFPLTKKIPV